MTTVRTPFCRRGAEGDLYESTIQALDGLYDKLSDGGFVIVDDYGNVAACRQAVCDFRAKRGITDPIRPIDWGGVYWRRAGDEETEMTESGGKR
jgi:O-methyltransferase